MSNYNFKVKGTFLKTFKEKKKREIENLGDA